MFSVLSPEYLESLEGRLAQKALQSCVHCGFCNATCPTYQLTGEELEGPRGRIYLMKAVLEGRLGITTRLRSHLDHCLSCLACETTCPGGVRYRHLIDPMRRQLHTAGRRSVPDRLQRALLARLLPHPARFRLALRLSQLARPLQPLLRGRLRSMLRAAPPRLPAPSALQRIAVHQPQGRPKARVALHTGCAQQVLAPEINDAAIRVLTRLGCQVVLAPTGCCGAIVQHMGAEAQALPLLRRNVDVFAAEQRSSPLEMIITTASGCGEVMKDYGELLHADTGRRQNAAQVGASVRDFHEAVQLLGGPPGRLQAEQPPKIAWHNPCSLAHGQKVTAEPPTLLRAAGFAPVDIPNGHLCCGSAGVYSLLQPGMATQLGQNKAEAIASTECQAIATANIGCMQQLGLYSGKPIWHTAQLLDWASGGPPPWGTGPSPFPPLS